MGPARHPHCAQRRYRVFVSRAGIRAPLTVPGDFVPRGQETQDAARFLPRLRATVRDLAPRPSIPHGTRASCVPSTLAHSAYVFVRRDSHRRGGGVACYVKNDIIYKILGELEDEQLEVFWIKIMPQRLFLYISR